MVDILSTLAEVSLEREEFGFSLDDYRKALSILEQIVEPDSRHLAELYYYRNFRISLCLEFGSKAQKAIPYCNKALSICKTRVQRLSEEAMGLSSSTMTEGGPEPEPENRLEHSSSTTEYVRTLTDIEAEKELLTNLSSELEKKLEDLQLLSGNPKSFLSEIFKAMEATASGSEAPSSAIEAGFSQMATYNSNGGFDSPNVTTAHTNGAASLGVTDLGVVRRGKKRVQPISITSESTQPISITSESTPAKRQATDASSKTYGFGFSNDRKLVEQLYRSVKMTFIFLQKRRKVRDVHGAPTSETDEENTQITPKKLKLDSYLFFEMDCALLC